MRSRDEDKAVLSRRETLAGIGLGGLFALAGARFLSSAEARPLDVRAVDAAARSVETAEADATAPDKAERSTTEASDITEFSARHRYWRRRYWRRRWYWRRRRHWYWRRRYWRRRYWRRRYWRRRYWW